MTAGVTLPVTGYAGWTFLKRTQARQEAALAANPVTKREEAYFRAKIGSVTTAQQLVADKRLLRVALGAFGLETDSAKTYFITRVLTDGTGEKGDLANRLSDKRYAQLADAFGLDGSNPATTADGFADTILSNWRRQKFEEAVGESDASLRSALFLERQLPVMAAKTSTERTKWFSVIGSEALSEVFQTAFALPESFGALDVDLQVTMLQKKARQSFGDSSLSQFSDATKLDKLIRLYLVRSQIAAGDAATGSSANALTILQSGLQSGASLFTRL